MSPRPDVSEERRAQIIEAAMKVVAEKGFAKTRMDDVASESGLSKGLIYWYFKSKEDILIAIARLLFGGEIRKMGNLKVEGQTARACLEDFLDEFIADLRNLEKITPVVYEFYALAFRNATVRSVMREFLHGFVSGIEPVIQAGMDSGEFAAGDAGQMALTVGATMEGTLLLWAYDPELVQLEEQLRVGMALLIDGMELLK